MKVPANIKQSEQTPNGIYSLELLELWDLRQKGNGLANNPKHRYAPKSAYTIAQRSATVNPQTNIDAMGRNRHYREGHPQRRKRQSRQKTCRFSPHGSTALVRFVPASPTFLLP